MKLRFYVDIYRGVDPARFSLCAWTQPPAKSEGTRRVAFNVTIPDSLLFEVDGEAAEVSAVEQVDA